MKTTETTTATVVVTYSPRGFANETTRVRLWLENSRHMAALGYWLDICDRDPDAWISMRSGCNSPVRDSGWTDYAVDGALDGVGLHDDPAAELARLADIGRAAAALEAKHA